MKMIGRSKVLRSSAVVVTCVGVILALMLLLPTTGAAAEQKGGAAKTLKIGYLLCLSGWYSVFDAVEEGHVKAVAQIINERGGIKVKGERYNIELVGEDGKSTLDGIAAGANKLVYDQKVKFVVGPTGFFSTGSSPVFEQNKVLHVSGYNSNQPGEMDKTTPYGFLGFDASIGTSIAAWKVAKKEYPKIKTFAVATPDDGAVPYLVPIIKKLMADYGYSIVGDVIPYPNEMEDFSPVAAKLNAIKGADAFFILNGAPVHHGNIAKGLRAMGNNKPIILQSLAPAEAVMSVAGKAASNDITCMGLTPGAKGNPKLLDEVWEKNGKKLPIFLFNPNGLWVLAKVIEAADSLEPDVVKAKWETMDKVDCLFGKCEFGGEKTYGLKGHAISHPLPYQKIKDGKVIYGGWVNVERIP
jgi:branched-chain amino acid transport system substrate-binding protein